VALPIESIDDLRAHVALATRVELSTIPPYLYAMYSIKDQRSEAARLIAAIVVEEMLHVCLTTNLLLALGGEPDFGSAVQPSYPGLVTHRKPDLALELRACSLALVRDTFMAIERPQPADAIPEDDDFETLGQFYAALEQAIDDLGAKTDLFGDHQPQRQLAKATYYDPVEFDAEDSGGLLLIHNRDTARSALDIVVHQGEGVAHERWADPAHLELTHYYKLELLASGTVPIGDVWPALDNPRTAELPVELQGVSNLVNSFYQLTLLTMADLFSGAGDQDAGISDLYDLMTHCLAPTARYLVAQPTGGGRTSGPTFEYIVFGDDPRRETARLAKAVATAHPDLVDVAAHVSGW
jgi:hypothetical protein